MEGRRCLPLHGSSQQCLPLQLRNRPLTKRCVTGHGHYGSKAWIEKSRSICSSLCPAGSTGVEVGRAWLCLTVEWESASRVEGPTLGRGNGGCNPRQPAEQQKQNPGSKYKAQESRTKSKCRNFWGERDGGGWAPSCFRNLLSGSQSCPQPELEHGQHQEMGDCPRQPACPGSSFLGVCPGVFSN